MSHYIKYYDEQIGGGGGIRRVYSGARYQRGHGVGAWLGGLFRKILPYVTSGAKAVGKEAVRAGIRVIDDVANNGANFKESVKMHTRQSGKTLKRKAADKISSMMKGEGYKARSRKRARQSKRKRSVVRTGRVAKGTSKKKKKRVSRKRRVPSKKKKVTFRSVNDIFG